MNSFFLTLSKPIQFAFGSGFSPRFEALSAIPYLREFNSTISFIFGKDKGIYFQIIIYAAFFVTIALIAHRIYSGVRSLACKFFQGLSAHHQTSKTKNKALKVSTEKHETLFRLDKKNVTIEIKPDFTIPAPSNIVASSPITTASLSSSPRNATPDNDTTHLAATSFTTPLSSDGANIGQRDLEVLKSQNDDLIAYLAKMEKENTRLKEEIEGICHLWEVTNTELAELRSQHQALIERALVVAPRAPKKANETTISSSALPASMDFVETAPNTPINESAMGKESKFPGAEVV